MEKARLGFDIALFVLYALPAALLFFLSLSCGTVYGREYAHTQCSLTFLEPLYDSVSGSPMFMWPMILIGSLGAFLNMFNIYDLPIGLQLAQFLILPFFVAVPVAFIGSVGFRFMSLSKGVAAVKKDWFGFLVVGASILFFLLSIPNNP